MRKEIGIGTIALLVATAAATLAAGNVKTADEAPRVRVFELSYKAVVRELPAEAGKIDIWLPYPQSDDTQQVEVTAVSSPYPKEIRKESKLGNGVLHIAAEHPGRTEIEISMIARVTRSERIRRAFGTARDHWQGHLDPAVAPWLEPDRLVPLDERIRGLAREVTAGKKTDLEKARAIYDYVVATMSYDKSGTGWGKGDIYWACDAKRGNCTDFHALFTGLARASGIPAKFEIGFPIPPERGEGKIGGYHCWSQFYLDGYGWVPVDASEAWKHKEKKEYFFGALDEDRVKFSEGRDLVLEPPQKGQPLNYFVYPYVEVDGKPHTPVELTFTYRDRPPQPAVSAPAASSGRR
ncbi:MAG TPA: transglutaminase domain-containing protein [Thermoanaerobaculia bacterium]|nr:transglutaminase domain-containing protein [Thermoanaerobaculia bacterium]